MAGMVSGRLRPRRGRPRHPDEPTNKTTTEPPKSDSNESLVQVKRRHQSTRRASLRGALRNMFKSGGGNQSNGSSRRRRRANPATTKTVHINHREDNHDGDDKEQVEAQPPLPEHDVDADDKENECGHPNDITENSRIFNDDKGVVSTRKPAKVYVSPSRDRGNNATPSSRIDRHGQKDNILVPKLILGHHDDVSILTMGTAVRLATPSNVVDASVPIQGSTNPRRTSGQEDKDDIHESSHHDNDNKSDKVKFCHPRVASSSFLNLIEEYDRVKHEQSPLIHSSSAAKSTSLLADKILPVEIPPSSTNGFPTLRMSTGRRVDQDRKHLGHEEGKECGQFYDDSNSPYNVKDSAQQSVATITTMSDNESDSSISWDEETVSNGYGPLHHLRRTIDLVDDEDVPERGNHGDEDDDAKSMWERLPVPMNANGSHGVFTYGSALHPASTYGSALDGKDTGTEGSVGIDVNSSSTRVAATTSQARSEESCSGTAYFSAFENEMDMEQSYRASKKTTNDKHITQGIVMEKAQIPQQHPNQLTVSEQVMPPIISDNIGAHQNSDNENSGASSCVFEVGQSVSVIGGKYEEADGTIIKITSQKAKVQLNNPAVTTYIEKRFLTRMISSRSAVGEVASVSMENQGMRSDASSARLAITVEPHLKAPSQSGSSLAGFDHTTNPVRAPSSMVNMILQEGMRVFANGGMHEDRIGRVLKLTAKKAHILLDPPQSVAAQIEKRFLQVLPNESNFDDIDETHLAHSPSPHSAELGSNECRNEHFERIQGNRTVSNLENSASSNGTDLELSDGQIVHITGRSKYAGKSGRVIKVTDKTATVFLGPSLTRPILKRFLTVADPSEHHQYDEHVLISPVEPPLPVDREPRSKQRTRHQDETLSSYEIGQTVKITKGSHQGKRGTVHSLTASMMYVECGEEKPFRVRISSVRPLAVHDEKTDDMKVHGFDYGGEKIENLYLGPTLTFSTKPSLGNYILAHLFGDRVRIFHHHVNRRDASSVPPKTFNDNGKIYELVATRDIKENNQFFGSLKKVECYTILKSGPHVQAIDVQKELARLADFSSLVPSKLPVRMDLLTTPTVKIGGEPAISTHPESAFKVIPDAEQYQGCGFISERMLWKLVGNMDLNSLVSIQVRCLIPKYGLFKGMLMRKRVMDGNHDFELNSSMQKVGPSRDQDALDVGCVAIKGVHPFPVNRYIGKMLDPDFKKPTTSKTFKNKIKKWTENDMVPRLFKALGAPTDEIKVYTKRAREPLGLRHAWTVGVADPTDALPPGHIFVTGLKDSVHLEKLFFTRSPCQRPSDGRMLPLVKTRPEMMSHDDWEWLNTLPFGAVIFAQPTEGMQPLPPFVAEGDLDGDLYLICWEESILRSLTTEPFVEIPLEDETAERAKEGAGDNWLNAMQEQIQSNILISDDIGRLTGRLWNLSEKIADKNAAFMSHEDAIACATACGQAIDYMKHRRLMKLPAHLIERVPAELRKYLIAT